MSHSLHTRRSADLEEGCEAKKLSGLLEQWVSSLETRAGHTAGAQKVVGTQTVVRRFQSQPGERVEDDSREQLPIVQDEGERADIEHLRSEEHTLNSSH